MHGSSSFQSALVRRLAPAAPDAPGTGEVSAQHAAAFPAPGLVVRNRGGIRGAAGRGLVPTSSGMRFIRPCVLPRGDSSIRERISAHIRISRRCDRSLRVPAGSAYRAVPVGTFVDYAKHEPATAFGCIVVCHRTRPFSVPPDGINRTGTRQSLYGK